MSEDRSTWFKRFDDVCRQNIKGIQSCLDTEEDEELRARRVLAILDRMQAHLWLVMRSSESERGGDE